MALLVLQRKDGEDMDQRKGTRLRQKHVPQRTCISCRQTGAKRGLVRLVRTPAGEIEVDPTGKRAGRGAYLCPKPECWERALKGKLLEQALRVTLNTDNRSLLQAYASTLISGDEDSDRR